MIQFLPLFKKLTYSIIPPSYLKLISFFCAALLSLSIIFTPVFKKASSLNLCSIVEKLNSIFLKIFVAGKKVILVPVYVFPSII